MPDLTLQNIDQRFASARHEPITALSNVSLAIRTGELLAIVGPSGSGKTTLLRLVAGLEQPTSGTIRFDEQDAQNIPPHERGLAVVFQSPALYPHLTAHENIAFGLRIRKIPAPEIEQRVGQASERLGITHLLNRAPHSLSGGERQRIALARAVVQRPSVLLFDEPLAGLDAPTRLQLRREIAKLHSEIKATTIYVTHDQTEAMAIGHRVAVLRHGTIEQIASPPDLYSRPNNLFVASFIGSPPINLFSGRIKRHTAPEADLGVELWFHETTASGVSNADSFTVPVAPRTVPLLRRHLDKPVLLGLRPENISPGAQSGPNRSEALAKARLELVEHLGPDTYLYLKTSLHTLTCRIKTGPFPDPGTTLKIQLQMEQALFFDPENEQLIS